MQYKYNWSCRPIVKKGTCPESLLPPLSVLVRRNAEYTLNEGIHLQIHFVFESPKTLSTQPLYNPMIAPCETLQHLMTP